jgi:amino acid transporter
MPPPDLRRELSLLDATMINVGTMIASAIFIVPAIVISHLGGSVPAVGVWVVGGAISLLGALCVAELGGAFPEAGGQYVYLREAFGPVWGFLYGWAAFAVINTASVAAIAVGFAVYAGYFVPLGPVALKLVALVSIVVLTALNCVGVRPGVVTQNVLTLAKIGALGVLIVAGLALPGGSAANLQPFWPAPGEAGLAGPVGLALIAVLWAYDGWIETTYVGSEIRDPGRVLPRSIILSTAIVVVVYTLAALAYTWVLSPGRMAGSVLVASDAARVTLGDAGATFVAIAILISTLGANNGIILTAARIPYAMARGGHFFAWAGKVHPRWLTPVTALVVQGAISAALLFTGTYEQLATYVVFASFVFYGMSCAAVVRLRRTRPDLPRPYRAWGYPLTPLVFIAFAAWLVGNTIAEAPRDAAIGAAIIVAGLPGYFYWRGKGKGEGGRAASE